MDKKLTLSDREWNLVANSLYIAGNRYDEDAKAVEESSIGEPGKARLVKEFKAQARDVRDIADRISESY